VDLSSRGVSGDFGTLARAVLVPHLARIIAAFARFGAQPRIKVGLNDLYRMPRLLGSPRRLWRSAM